MGFNAKFHEHHAEIGFISSCEVTFLFYIKMKEETFQGVVDFKHYKVSCFISHRLCPQELYGYCTSPVTIIYIRPLKFASM